MCFADLAVDTKLTRSAYYSGFYSSCFGELGSDLDNGLGLEMREFTPDEKDEEGLDFLLSPTIKEESEVKGDDN